MRIFFVRLLKMMKNVRLVYTSESAARVQCHLVSTDIKVTLLVD